MLGLSHLTLSGIVILSPSTSWQLSVGNLDTSLLNFVVVLAGCAVAMHS